MKRAFLAVLLAMLIPLTGCEPAAVLSTASPVSGASALPEVRPPAAALDFGKVTLLLNSRKSTLDDKDIVRQERILQAVSLALQQQTGVRMELTALPVMEPAEKLRELAAAGNPPEICVLVPKGYGEPLSEEDKLFTTSLVPLPLDDALTTYGHNLRRLIPEPHWQYCTVAGKVLSIPILRTSSFAAVLNQAAMDRFGWQMPSTAEEFELLLAQAKAQGLHPVLSAPWFNASLGWFNAIQTDVLTQTDDGPQPFRASENHLEWLQQQRRWVEQGWLSLERSSDMEQSAMERGQWLCREMRLDELGNTPDIAVLPPLKVPGHEPVCSPVHTGQIQYESYARPETLVILLDWMHAGETNNRLLTLGQQDVDYRLLHGGEYEWMDGPSWQGFYQLPISAAFATTHPLRSNPAAYDQVLDYARQYGVSTDNPFALPYGSVEYRRRGTRLDRAIQAELAYGEAVFPSESAYLRGEKSLTDHMETLAQSAPLLKEYIELAQDVQAGRYDVWQDVVEVK